MCWKRLHPFAQKSSILWRLSDDQQKKTKSVLTIKANVTWFEREFKERVLLDIGASISLVRKQLAETLASEGQHKRLT
jgi:hypothetical protein